MKTPVKQKKIFGEMAKAKANKTVANTNKTTSNRLIAGVAAKVAAKKEAKAAATKPAPATKPATPPAPMQKYGAAKGKPAAKMKKC